jgi:DNA-binding MarR family transcriptional regulator
LVVVVAMLIGIVVHPSRRGVFEQAARTLSGVTLEWVVYEDECEIGERVGQLFDRQHVDGLLLGPVPYTACRDLLPDDLSVAVVRPSEVDLALAFFQAAAQGWKPTPVSIDTFEAPVVAEVTAFLGLDTDQISSLPYAGEQSAADIVTFHQRFLERAGGGYIISARTAVFRHVDGTLPVVSALPVPSTIRRDLHELALRIQSERASALRFAAAVFLLVKHGGDTELDRARVGLMNMLLNTPEFSGAWVDNRGRNGVVVLAHRAQFARITEEWTSVPALGQAADTLGIRVAAGFGVGSSARICVQLAERAAARSEQERVPCGYLIEDSGVVIGPMGPAAGPQVFTYREHGTAIEDLAREAGLSPATLSRLAAIERTLEGRAISPSDLAGAVGITDPSGRRLIRKLNASGLVSAEGSAQLNRKGRPSNLYRLAIGDAIARRAKRSQP